MKFRKVNGRSGREASHAHAYEVHSETVLSLVNLLSEYLESTTRSAETEKEVSDYTFIHPYTVRCPVARRVTEHVCTSSTSDVARSEVCRGVRSSSARLDPVRFQRPVCFCSVVTRTRNRARWSRIEAFLAASWWMRSEAAEKRNE